MKKAILILAILATNAMAQNIPGIPQYTDQWNTNTMFQNKMTVEIVVSKNVSRDCDKERVARGEKPFNLPSRACTFYRPGNCKIIIGETVSDGTLGHEMHHCVAGSFH